MRNPYGHIARAPMHQHRPADRYEVDVAGVGTGPDPLSSPPLFSSDHSLV
jgi:hypothetical protein